MGQKKDKNDYIKQNSVAESSIYPNRIDKDEAQDATIAVISARDNKRNRVLIAEINWGVGRYDGRC